ncbi:MAG: CHRD domain-containing protein [Acidimicrobiales bacterium]
MRRMRRLLVGAGVMAAIAVGGSAPAAADHNVRVLATVMTGAEEVPGPGDSDGIGVAGLVVGVDRGRICYALAVRKIAPANAAHIHRGVAGEAGPIEVALNAPTRGFSAACRPVDPALAAEIANTPDQFYVNVHNADFPAGAVRGQLG